MARVVLRHRRLAPGIVAVVARETSRADRRREQMALPPGFVDRRAA